MPKLTIRQWPLPIETGKGTILDAALERGVPFPHGCRTGECGACKCLLLSGDVTMKNYDNGALTESNTSDSYQQWSAAYATLDGQRVEVLLVRADISIHGVVDGRYLAQPHVLIRSRRIYQFAMPGVGKNLTGKAVYAEHPHDFTIL